MEKYVNRLQNEHVLNPWLCEPAHLQNIKVKKKKKLLFSHHALCASMNMVLVAHGCAVQVNLPTRNPPSTHRLLAYWHRALGHGSIRKVYFSAPAAPSLGLLSCTLYLFISHLPSHLALTLIFIFLFQNFLKPHSSMSLVLTLLLSLSTCHFLLSPHLIICLFFLLHYFLMIPVGSLTTRRSLLTSPPPLVSLLSHSFLSLLFLSSFFSTLIQPVLQFLPFRSASCTLLLLSPLLPLSLHSFHSHTRPFSLLPVDAPDCCLLTFFCF